MALATKSEYGTMFIIAQQAIPICTTLTKMRWPHGPTLIQVDSPTTAGIANKAICQKKSKAMDMMFYLINYRITQG